jgi:hypothetical protein
VEKSVFKLQVKQQSAMPKTLTISNLHQDFGAFELTCYQVHGTAEDGTSVWVGTFFDKQEAEAWVQASVIYGRAVQGGEVPSAPQVNDAPRIVS